MQKTLIAATDCLADVLARENAALRAMDLRGAMTMLLEKTAAINDFSAAGGDVPASAPLIVAARRLDGLALENRRLLERAIVAQQRLIGIVVRAAAAAMARPCYSAKPRPERTAGPMAFSTRI